MENQQEEIKTIFRIPECNIENLKAKLDKLNKTAAKLGCTPIEFEELEREVKIEKKYVPGFEGVESMSREIVKVWIHCRVEGEAPVFNGWKFVAKLDRTEHGTILDVVPGEESLPERFRNTDKRCDHCNTSRDRKRLYVVKAEDGTFKQVGASCLRDFLGHTNPALIATWLEYITEIENMCKDEEGGFGFWNNGHEDVSLHSLCAIAYSIIKREGGYKSRREVEAFGGSSTGDTVSYLLWKPNFTGPHADEAEREWTNMWERYQPTDDSRAKAEEVVAWMRELDTTGNDYLHNLKTVALDDAVSSKRAALAASGVWAYLKAVERMEKEQRHKEELATKSNLHIGEVGKRAELEVKLVGWKERYDSFEDKTTVMMKFEDGEGNSIVWWTGAVQVINDGDALSWKDNTLEEGATMMIRATVKRHGEFKGRNITNVNRCFPVQKKA